jgi:hypothetical protein
LQPILNLPPITKIISFSSSGQTMMDGSSVEAANFLIMLNTSLASCRA